MKTNSKNILRHGALFLGILSLVAGIAMMAASSYLMVRFGDGKSLTPPASVQIFPDKKDFNVAFFGDFAMQSDVVVPIIKEISAKKPDFAICVGDMFRAVRGVEGDYLVELLQNNLSVPCYAIPGNHDVEKENDLDKYNRHFGNPCYFFSYGDTLFIMLNDVYLMPPTPEIAKFLPPEYWSKKYEFVRGMEEKDLLWVENVLSHYRKDFRRCVLVMHVPPVIPQEISDYAVNCVVGHQLKSIVRKFPIDAIVSGHLHISGQSSYEGIPVYHVPCSGQMLRDTVHPYYGYCTLHFTESGRIEATPHYLPGLERGRNYLLNYLAVEIPGNCRYYVIAWCLLFAGIGFLAAARKLS